MRYSDQTLKLLFEQFNRQHFYGEVAVVPVEINENLTSTAGYARWKYQRKVCRVMDKYGTVRDETLKLCVPTRIEISGPIFDHYGWDYISPGWEMPEVQNVLLHEMTHIYLAGNFNDEGHSKHFHNIMTRITGVHGNHRCHHLNVANVTRKKSVLTGFNPF